MSDGDRHGMSHHPAPHRDRASLWEMTLGVAGGPFAWLLQLCANYGLAGAPCFTGPERGFDSSANVGILVVYLVCLAIALAGFLVALRIYLRTRHEKAGGADEVFERGDGRTRFLGLWGMLLGGGFGGIILLNGIALMGIPACAL